MSQTATSQPKESFEEALKALEDIVEAMESGDVPLAEMVSQFEEGNKLLKICQKRLQAAELKIVKLKQENQELTLEAFEAES